MSLERRGVLKGYYGHLLFVEEIYLQGYFCHPGLLKMLKEGKIDGKKCFGTKRLPTRSDI